MTTPGILCTNTRVSVNMNVCECVCGAWIIMNVSKGKGSINIHRGGFNDMVVNLTASHLLGGSKTLWCYWAKELKHMGITSSELLAWVNLQTCTFQKAQASSICAMVIKLRRGWFSAGAPLAMLDIWCYHDLLVPAWWRISWFTQQLTPRLHFLHFGRMKKAIIETNLKFLISSGEKVNKGRRTTKWKKIHGLQVVAALGKTSLRLCFCTVCYVAHTMKVTLTPRFWYRNCVF